MTMVFTAPYPDNNQTTSALPYPAFDRSAASKFALKHGTGVQAVSISVSDVPSSIEAMVANGAEIRVPPTKVQDKFGHGEATVAEVLLYGNVHLRLVDAKNFRGSFLPNYQDVPPNQDRALPFTSEQSPTTAGTDAAAIPAKRDSTYGFRRFDHVVGNLWSLEPRKSQLQRMTVRYFIY